MCQCDPNCNGFCTCLTAGCKKPSKETLLELLVTFLGCAAIEWGFELGWKGEDKGELPAWAVESLISSGASATYAVIISSVILILFEKCKLRNETQDDNLSELHFYTAFVLSQLLSGLISFGIGVAFDAIFHKTLDNLESKEEVLQAVFVPLAMVGFKVFTRNASAKFFKNNLKNCVEEEDYGELMSINTGGKLYSTFN